MADGDVVIRDDAGTEHVFPPGFDVQRAIGIVRAANYRPDPTMQDASARAIAARAGYLVPPRKQTDELGNDVAGMAEGPAKQFVRNIVTNPVVQGAAHPSSLSDIAPMLIPGTAGPGDLSAPSLGRGILRTVKAGEQAAADGSYAGMPMRFMRGALSELRRPLEVERYAPNISADSHAMTGAAEAMPKGLPQGVYAQLPDGSWGVKALPGHQLVEGEAINVMSRAGIPKVITAGKVGSDGVAALQGAALPSEQISIGGVNVTDPKVLELIRQRLGGQ